MTPFHIVAMWSLRALVVWGAIETGLTLYDISATHWTALAQVRGHEAIMARLSARAAAAESEAALAQQRLASDLGGVLALPAGPPDETLGARLASVLRETLTAAGAQAPVIDVVEEDAGLGRARLRLNASWREPDHTPPAILLAAARFPSLRVETLSARRLEAMGLVEWRATLIAVAAESDIHTAAADGAP